MFGTVTKWFDNKGYGFIRGADGKDYFIHRSKLDGEYIERGYYVSFRTFQGEKGDKAKNVIVVEAPERRKRK